MFAATIKTALRSKTVEDRACQAPLSGERQRASDVV